MKLHICFNNHSFITQIYFYASYIFQEAGISAEHTQYVTIGSGTCEFTACILCVSGQKKLINSYYVNVIWHLYCKLINKITFNVSVKIRVNRTIIL